jgi:plasmid stability protein
VRITINLPDDLHERIAIDALRKPHNSKEAVVTEILRAHYGGGSARELTDLALGWRIDRTTSDGVLRLRRAAKDRWK